MDYRKIDKLIAEKVLGWTESELILPNFSTNMQSAWLIVNKWAEEGRFFEIHKWIDGPYVVTLETDRQENNFELQREADMASMAICLAALKLAGVEV